MRKTKKAKKSGAQSAMEQRIEIIDKYFDARLHEMETLIARNKDKLAEGIEQRLTRTEEQLYYAQAHYDDLRDSLISLLTPAQKEAAKISFCAPEKYAIEWMKICIERSEASKHQIPMTSIGEKLP